MTAAIWDLKDSIQQQALIARLRDWQREAGRAGAPSADEAADLAKWVAKCRGAFRDGTLPDALGTELMALGVRMEPRPTRPRRIAHHTLALQSAMSGFIRQNGRAPVLLGGAERERALAVWSVCLSGGLASARDMPHAVSSGVTHVAGVLSALARVQPARELAAEWWLLGELVATLARARGAGMTWQSALIRRPHGTLKAALGGAVVGAYERIRDGRDRTPGLLSPEGLCGVLRRELDDEPEEVTGALRRREALGQPIVARLTRVGFNEWLDEDTWLARRQQRREAHRQGHAEHGTPI